MFTRLLFKGKRVKDLYNKKCCTGKKCHMKSFTLYYIQEELRNCTTHGLPYILNSRLHFVERLFWVISFTGSVIFMVLLLWAQYTRFIESPTVMSVEMNYFDWNVSYPAITLCPLHKTDVVLYKRLVNKTSVKTGLKTDSFLWSVVSGGMDNLGFIYLDIPENISALLHPRNYSKMAAQIFRKFPNNSLTTNTNWTISVETAMTEVGMCHVINSNVASYDNPLKWNRDKLGYTRSNLELTVYEGDFLAKITNYAPNYKVYIHHPDELVLSTSPSFTFDMEGFVNFGLSVWSTRVFDEIRPLPISSRKCRFINEPINKRYPVYSYNHCILECRIGIIQQLCGCVPHFYKPLDSERVCSINELKCVLKYKKEIMSLTIPKGLNGLSSSDNLPKSSRYCNCLSNCETDIYHKDNEEFTYNKSIGRLQVGITSFPKIRVVRDVIFHTYDILLRSGGLINLFIGSSVLSIMELLVIIFKFIVYFICKFWKR